MRRSRFLWVVVIALPVAAMIGASAVGGEEVAPVAQPSIGGTTIENHASGLSIRVPDGWQGLTACEPRGKRTRVEEQVIPPRFQGKVRIDIRESTPDWAPYFAPNAAE